MKKFLTLATISLAAAMASAHPAPDTTKSTCPVSAAYMLEAGRSAVSDSYLSPIEYSGLRLGLSGTWSKTLTRRAPRVVMATDAMLDFSSGSPAPPASHTLLSVQARAAWSVLYTFRPAPGLTLMAGGGPDITGGVLYLPSNSNNPADAIARLDLTARLAAGWRTRIGRLPVRVIDRVALLLAGMMFAPQYGETYWEISLGNRHGLVHPRYWGRAFAIDNLLAVDLGLGRNSLRIGYRFTFENSYAGRNTRQTLSHSFVIGLTTDCLRPATPRPVRTIKAEL